MSFLTQHRNDGAINPQINIPGQNNFIKYKMATTQPLQFLGNYADNKNDLAQKH